MTKLTNFLPSIDNLSDVKDVHSILMVPVFGHRARMIRTDTGEAQEEIFREMDDSKRKPIAILQFVNKTNFSNID